MNDKAKEADLKLLKEMKKIISMIEDRYGFNRFKIGDKVWYYGVCEIDQTPEEFTGTITAIDDMCWLLEINEEIWAHPKQCRKIEA